MKCEDRALTAIVDIIGREILDSRGNPTVRSTWCWRTARSAAPCRRRLDRRARGGRTARRRQKRYLGKGVLKAVAAVNGEIFDAVGGMDAEQQAKIDETLITLDGSVNKGRLGANAILGVSLAVAKAAAAARGLPLYRYVGGTSARLLPVPMMNIINGGVHADNPIDFRILDHAARRAEFRRKRAAHGRRGVPDPENFSARERAQYQCGRRGRLCANLKSADEALSFVVKAIEAAGYRPGEQVARWRSIRLQPNSSKMANMSEGEGKRSIDEQAKYLAELVSRYPIVSIEDGMAEDDFAGWKQVTDLIGAKCQLVGDDLFVTNVTRLSEGIKRGLGNSILVKVNQIGTLTEALAAVEMAHKAGYTAVMSHRSGETEDATIADLAVATNCGQIKTGSLARSDRTAKYNQLLRIEQELGAQAQYAGKAALQAGALDGAISEQAGDLRMALLGRGGSAGEDNVAGDRSGLEHAKIGRTTKRLTPSLGRYASFATIST